MPTAALEQEVFVATPEAMRRLAARVAAAAREIASRRGFVVALLGELGAGKTVFVQGVARGLAVPPGQPVVSPTFTVATEHFAGGEPPCVLCHVDAYRLSGPDELDAAGGEEMFGPGRLTCVEWADRVDGALPAGGLRIRVDALPPPDDRDSRAGDADDPGVAPRRLRLSATGEDASRVLILALGDAGA